MIYAINRRTKEHSVVPDCMIIPPSSDHRLFEADDNGWIPWHGGECPLPDGALTDVKHQDGDVFLGSRARAMGSAHDWSHTHGDGSIVAYRPILDAKPEVTYCKGCGDVGISAFGDPCPVCDEPEAPAWDGEGLPPVGERCEMLAAGWEEVFIAGKDSKGRIIAEVTASGMLIPSGNAERFRPIRTEEDRAVEEMRAVTQNSHDAPTFYHALYRAGYRKD